jgi:hypothetical protein
MPKTRPDVYAYSLALEHFDMDLPFGVSPDYAYQTFLSLDPNGTASRPGSQRPVSVAVEGLFMETECLRLEDMDYTVNSTGESPMIDLRFEGCDTTFTRALYPQPWYYNFEGTRESIWEIDYVRRTMQGFFSSEEKPCPALPQQNPAFLYYAIVLGPSPQNSSEAQVDTIAAVICSSLAWISTVEMADDGLSPNGSQSTDSASKSGLDVDPWKLISLINDFDDAIIRNTNDTVGPVNWFYESMGKRLNKQMSRSTRVTSSEMPSRP